MATTPQESPPVVVGGMSSVESLDVLDWEFCIESPPVRRSGVVEADAEFVGRSRPIPLEDPRPDQDA